MNEARLTFIADVINMFGLQGVCDSIKSPLAPLFEKGGNAHTPAFLITASSSRGFRVCISITLPMACLSWWHS